jgi:hypothetical protein
MTNSEHQLVMYRAIAHGDVASLRGLVAQLPSDNRDFARFAICLDHIYTLPVNLESSDREETATTLRLLLLYANRIRLTGTTAQSIRTDVQRLELMMNIHVNSQTFRYSILTGVFIRAWAEDQRPSKKTLLAQQTYPWMSMTRDDVLALTKKALEARVRHRLASAATQCLRSPEFSPLPEGSSVGDPHHCIQWRQDRLGLFNDILRIVASVRNALFTKCLYGLMKMSRPLRHSTSILRSKFSVVFHMDMVHADILRSQDLDQQDVSLDLCRP